MPKFQLIFPQLSGSDKQRSWAESIRRKLVNDFINHTANGMSNFIATMGEEPCTDIPLKKAIEHVINQHTAAFWIDHRNDSMLLMVKDQYERNLQFSRK